MNLNQLMMEYLATVGWALVAALSMSISMAILQVVYNKLTPNIDETEELKKGNLAVAIVMGAVILSFGFVVGMAVSGGGPVHFPPAQ